MDQEFKDRWNNRWEQGSTPWVNANTNSMLVKYLKELLNGKQPNNQTILVPFCGKSPDLLWLHQQGMNVIGVELIAKPCEEFFKENKLAYTVEEPNADYKVYVHDSHLKIVLGDWFNLDSSLFGDKQVDFVWDCHSLSALPYDMQERYLQQMRKLISPSARSLVFSFEWDPAKRGYPPSSMTDDVMANLFRQGYDYRLLEKSLNDEKLDVRPKWGIGENAVVYLYQYI